MNRPASALRTPTPLFPAQKDERLFGLLEVHLKRVPKAIRYLRKVTGKLGYKNTWPTPATRRDKQFWESYHTLVNVVIMLQYGKSLATLTRHLMKKRTKNRTFSWKSNDNGDWSDLTK